ncbi:putative uba ts-n domain-containing protein [Erysiphe neolycopersici]|uniref:Putative uba ts-n domain-containing protein n=1 Tax=Erysiphe neolycopersici TaxID=212602 RepID=A0A420HSJ3_9PEZI|nr:putative uba ts-n domain-containing protein [Erysiphe neolycopersici]
MEDNLNGLNWSAAPSVANIGRASTMNCFPSKQHTLPSRNLDNSLPISIQKPNYGKSIPKSTPVFNAKTTDSFSNLVSFSSPKESTLTLQEQQRRLDAEKRKQAAEKQNQFNMQFGNKEFWDSVGSKSPGQEYALPAPYQNSIPVFGSSVSRQRSVSPPTVNGSAIVGHGADKDLFAAFNSETSVDVSSHYPPPKKGLNEGGEKVYQLTKNSLDLSKPQAWGTFEASTDLEFGEDDDPFGLSEVKPTFYTVPMSNENEEDLLGDLGKPVEELRRLKTSTPDVVLKVDEKENNEDPWDAALKKLVQMGFSVEESRRALIKSDSKLDIQAAVNWLLNSSQIKTHIQKPKNKTSWISEARDISTNEILDHQHSPKMRNDSINGSKYDSSKTTENFDISRDAIVVGNNILKTANSLWKTSQKKVHKVVSEFQQQDAVSDPSQPKWMRSNPAHRDLTRRLSLVERRTSVIKTQYITDEALLLESRDQSPEIKAIAPVNQKSSTNLLQNQFPNTSKILQPACISESRRRNFLYQESRSKDGSTTQDSEQAYTSPARRKKRSPLVTPSERDSKPSYIEGSNSSHNSFLTPKPSISVAIRPKPLPRNLPHISPATLQSSTQYRLAGTSHFKRGDFASAYTSYSSSLEVLPPTHPINIVLLCNRALTSLKNGLPKSAILDTDKALDLIGESRGDGETIDLGPGPEGGLKQMKTFYGKALLRKAEALEQMEKWKEAGEVWKKCVEQGIGGSAAAEGRTRCEKLLAPKSPPAKLSRISSQKKLVRGNSHGMNTGDSAAIKRLREANEKAEIADNQKLELVDRVDARIGLWKDGKSDNLRALIGSLDLVLWEGSGWKSVGLHELIQNNKVKINYMKAIGKTHPDKLPQDASMEVRMIAAQVFATLNESWDTFKRQNGL